MKKVVSATLAGALAVGMVPAMALADDAIELQTVDTDAAFEAGTVTATDQDGNAITDLTNVKYTKVETYAFTTNAQKAQYIIPTAFDPEEMDPVAITYESGVATNFDVAYYKRSGANPTGDAIAAADMEKTFVKKGTYCVVVSGKADTAYEGVSVQLNFDLVDASIEGAVLYEVNDDNPNDFSDAEFTFVGTSTPLAAKEFGVALNGAALESGCYTITYGKVGAAEKGFTADAPAAVGDYVALIKGVPSKGYAGTARAPFSISPYDLSKQDLSIAAVAENSSLPAVSKVVNLPKALQSSLELVYESGNLSFGEKGSYVYTLQPKADLKELFKSGIVNSKDITIDVVEDAALTFMYGSSKLTATTYDVNLSDATSATFDATKVDVWSDDKGTDKDIAFKIVITDEDGNKSEDLNLLKKPGKWTVNVVVDGSANDWDYAGVSAAVTVNVTAGEINLSENAYVKYNGVVTDEIVKTYNGVDALTEIVTVVKGEVTDTTLVKGTDYTVKVEKLQADNKTWKEVEAAADAGSYRLTFESDTYDFTGGAVVNLTVNALDVYPVIADELKQTAGFDMLYTGVALNPIVNFQMKDAATGKMVDLPSTITVAATDYKVTIDSFVDQVTNTSATIVPKEFAKAGTYVFDIADVAGGNFVVKADSNNTALPDLLDISLLVDGRDVFVDVPSGKWYAQPIYQMASKGIVGGYGNGLFGPMDNCDREDYALMIARMLNGVARLTVDSSNDNTTGGPLSGEVILPFKDVDKKAYYAEAVWYVWKNGIMGQNVGNVFGVDQDITREEAVTVLYRIDQAGLYKNGLTMLGFADYLDADEVSGWAVEAMTWGVDNAIVGVNTQYLNPGDPISRAEIAAILARYMELRKMA